MEPNRYRTSTIVRFAHCDPAGIIFYPRYFDLAHEAKEDWFREALDWPFPLLIGKLGHGFPIVRLAAQFAAPSRLGERLDFVVSVRTMGRTSLGLDYEASCAGQLRMRASTTVVHVRLATGAPIPIEGELRERIERFREGRP